MSAWFGLEVNILRGWTQTDIKTLFPVHPSKTEKNGVYFLYAYTFLTISASHAMHA